MIALLRTLLGTGLFMVLAAGVDAQEARPDPGPTTTARNPAAASQRADNVILDRKDLVVRYYRLENPLVNVDDLMRAATAVFGRSFYVDDMDRRAPARNFFVVGESLAVFETAKRADMIMKALPEMERAAVPSPHRTEPYVSEVVRLVHIPAHLASSALRPFYREPRSNVPNFVMTDPTGNTIILRDRPEAVEEMKSVLVRLDVPSEARSSPTAINLDCHVIRASKEAVSGPSLPGNLTESLARLTGWKHFEDLGMVAVRASTGAAVEAEVLLADDHQASLAFDRLSTIGDTLHIGTVVFRLQSQQRGSLHSLKTSTEVKDGEYTVIGAFGSVPYFLVIQARY